MRQGEKHQIGVGELIRRRLGQTQRGQATDAWMQVADRLAGVRVRGRGDDVEVGMRCQQTQQLAPRIATGPGDCDSITHTNDYALLRK